MTRLRTRARRLFQPDTPQHRPLTRRGHELQFPRYCQTCGKVRAHLRVPAGLACAGCGKERES